MARVSSGPNIIIFVLFLLWSLERDTSIAWGTRKQDYSHSNVGRMKQMYSTEEETTTTPLQYGGSSPVFNVLEYGAEGDGTTDDTEAFEDAWEAACEADASTMLVPFGSEFLVKPISFSGVDCQEKIVFQLDGRIIAPTSPKAWGSGLLQWLEFRKLNGITLRGNGTIDGQGSVWWKSSPMDDAAEAEGTELATLSKYSDDSSSQRLIGGEIQGKMPSKKPTAVRFHGSKDVTVIGITIENSPRTHLKFDNCAYVQVYNVTISSPGDSPNTDGIHLQNSQDVVIHDSDLACGDDCISIQTGCSGIYVHKVSCGPGHGISIGGLGKHNTRACVSNITVQDAKMHSTLTGVRIKTWQGGSGSVQGVKFSNIQVSEVKTPIMIDQYYCNGHKCPNKTSAVAISGISFTNVKGTYTLQPVYFACSDSRPCKGVDLKTIQLKAVQEHHHLYGPLCWQTYGQVLSKTTPPIDCLLHEKTLSHQVVDNKDACSTDLDYKKLYLSI